MVEEATQTQTGEAIYCTVSHLTAAAATAATSGQWRRLRRPDLLPVLPLVSAPGGEILLTDRTA